MMSLSTKEPTIHINGVALSEFQAMTIRVALESFAALLSEPDALGKGVGASKLAEMYKTYLAQVQLLINMTDGAACPT